MLAARFVEAGICARMKCGKDVNGQRHLFWDGETTRARRERHDPDRRLGGAETVVESFSNRERPQSGCAARRHLATVARGGFSHVLATSDTASYLCSLLLHPRGCLGAGHRGAENGRSFGALTGVERAIESYRHSVATTKEDRSRLPRRSSAPRGSCASRVSIRPSRENPPRYASGARATRYGAHAAARGKRHFRPFREKN